MQPSLIRIEADEITYNLHIILRFELERRLSRARSRSDLPDGVERGHASGYLGLEVPTTRGRAAGRALGGGLFGYFPTYTLGNVIAAQLWDAHARATCPDLDGQIERGDFTPLREWLRENVHRHGRKFPPRSCSTR